MSAERVDCSGDLILHGGGLLRRWAAFYRGGTQIGFPAVNVIRRVEARMVGEADDGPPPPMDAVAEQVEVALLALQQRAPAPYAVLRGFYLPRDPVPMEAVARSLQVSRTKASEWHLMGLAWVVARVEH